MTLEQVRVMSDEEKRVKLAEACGYTQIDLPFGWVPVESIGDLPQMIRIP